jgi:hypothetical protein
LVVYAAVNSNSHAGIVPRPAWAGPPRDAVRSQYNVRLPSWLQDARACLPHAPRAPPLAPGPCPLLAVGPEAARACPPLGPPLVTSCPSCGPPWQPADCTWLWRGRYAYTCCVCVCVCAVVGFGWRSLGAGTIPSSPLRLTFPTCTTYPPAHMLQTAGAVCIPGCIARLGSATLALGFIGVCLGAPCPWEPGAAVTLLWAGHLAALCLTVPPRGPRNRCGLAGLGCVTGVCD